MLNSTQKQAWNDLKGAFSIAVASGVLRTLRDSSPKNTILSQKLGAQIQSIDSLTQYFKVKQTLMISALASSFINDIGLLFDFSMEERFRKFFKLTPILYEDHLEEEDERMP